eukprot:1195586-Prorocentrum_minimum.AAC.5
MIALQITLLKPRKSNHGAYRRCRQAQVRPWWSVSDGKRQTRWWRTERQPFCIKAKESSLSQKVSEQLGTQDGRAYVREKLRDDVCSARGGAPPTRASSSDQAQQFFREKTVGTEERNTHTRLCKSDKAAEEKSGAYLVPKKAPSRAARGWNT